LPLEPLLSAWRDLVDSAAIARGELEVITRNAEKYMEIVRAARY